MTEAEDMTTGSDDIAGRTKRGLLWRLAPGCEPTCRHEPRDALKRRGTGIVV